MTRNERIAERISMSERAPAIALAGCPLPCRGVRVIAKRFLSGAFDDLLGPEVTEEVLDDLRESSVTSQSFWRYARMYVRYAMADARRGDPWRTREQWAEGWQRFRRIAKFLRALEKGVSK